MTAKPTITFTRVPRGGRRKWSELTMDSDGFSFGDELLRVIEQIDGVIRVPYPEPTSPNRLRIILPRVINEDVVAMRIMRGLMEHYNMAADTVTVFYPSQAKPAS